MSFEFKNLDDLYNRILPALSFKKREIKKQGIEITEKDIFNDLKIKWSKKINLTLSDIVEDIMSYKRYM